MNVKNICERTHFSPNKVCGNFKRSVQDGRIFIESEGIIDHGFPGSDLLLN